MKNRKYAAGRALLACLLLFGGVLCMCTGCSKAAIAGRARRLFGPPLAEMTAAQSAADRSVWAEVQPAHPETIAFLREHMRTITHAAGTLDGTTGSNSLEGLQNAYDHGCRFIELDFQFTSDGGLACIHDWYRQYTSAIPADGCVLSMEEFRKAKIYDRFTPMNLDTVASFLRTHPDCYIITDVKARNTEAVRAIAEACPDLTEQFIIQIYDGTEYDAVRAAGFDAILFTLYRLDWAGKTDVDALCTFAAGHPLLGYTFAAELCGLDGYVEGMLRAGVPLYVHTVNGEENRQTYYDMGIAGIYTDDVVP